MRLALLLAVLLLAACDDSPSEPVLPMHGTYALVTVDGAALPVDASFVDSSGTTNRRALLSAELRVGADGTWEEVRRYEAPSSVGGRVRFFTEHFGTWESGRLMRGGPDGPWEIARMTRDRDGLSCEHADGVYRYQATE